MGEKNPRAIAFSLDDLATVKQKASQALRRTDSGLKRNSLRRVIEAATDAIDGAKGIESIPAAIRLYQFRIALNESDPPIWRRIQIKDCTLDRLHEHIQTSMGWTNSHLHQFEINGERYGDPELLDDGFADFHCVDSTVTKISQVVPKNGNRFRFLYEYDFGDGWEHEVLFEGCLRAEKGVRYPLCLEGERSCPPEDVGGVWGYSEFLEALADSSHESYDDYKAWVGDFDPEAFDAERATKAMRRGLPDWRQYE